MYPVNTELLFRVPTSLSHGPRFLPLDSVYPFDLPFKTKRNRGSAASAACNNNIARAQKKKKKKALKQPARNAYTPALDPLTFDFLQTLSISVPKMTNKFTNHEEHF
jgi:hypothetical protein